MSEKKRAYVGLRLPPAFKEAIDGLVEKGLYLNVSEFLRQAAREKLDRDKKRHQTEVV